MSGLRSYMELMVRAGFDQTVLMPDPNDTSDSRPAWAHRYLICSEPRSGSNLLCDYLFQLGFGVPCEYFEDAAANVLMRRWRATPTNYGDELLRHRTMNGVVGAKITYAYEWNRALNALWPNRPIIRTRRRDRNAQAMSLARANRRGTWCYFGPDLTPASKVAPVEVSDFDLKEAARRIDTIGAFFDRAVETYPFVEVWFEDLVERPAETIDGVLRTVFGEGLPDGYELPEPRVKAMPK